MFLQGVERSYDRTYARGHHGSSNGGNNSSNRTKPFSRFCRFETCSKILPQTTSTSDGPTPRPFPVTFSVEGPAFDPDCNNNVICTVFANNTGVPLVSGFGEFYLQNGMFEPAVINTVPGTCATYPSLPMLQIEFLGSWNATSIVGEW